LIATWYKLPIYYLGLDEQVEAWPLPQLKPHSAQTHFGSCGSENTVTAPIINPNNTNTKLLSKNKM
jgi:hypothetical protein